MRRRQPEYRQIVTTGVSSRSFRSMERVSIRPHILPPHIVVYYALASATKAGLGCQRNSLKSVPILPVSQRTGNFFRHFFVEPRLKDRLVLFLPFRAGIWDQRVVFEGAFFRFGGESSHKWVAETVSGRCCRGCSRSRWNRSRRITRARRDADESDHPVNRRITHPLRLRRADA